MRKKVFLFLLLGLFTSCSNEKIVKKQVDKKEMYRTFSFKTEGKLVFLSGNFNKWKLNDEKFKFKKLNHLWELKVPLSLFKKGKNEYKIIVDNEWKINLDEPKESHSLMGDVNFFILP